MASKKPAVIAKGKNQDIEKWEAELRKSIATKKATANTTLSKQDRALVDAQLKVESSTRKKIQRIKTEAERGFGLIRSAVNSRVVQFEQHASTLLTLLLSGALRLGTPLVGSLALDVYFVGTTVQNQMLASFRVYALLLGLSFSVLRPSWDYSTRDRNGHPSAV